MLLPQDVLVCAAARLGVSRHALSDAAGVLPGMSIAGQRLAKHDVDTGELLWQIDLSSPIVAVLPPTDDLQARSPSSRLQGQPKEPTVPRRPQR